MSKPRTWPSAECSSRAPQQELPPQCSSPGMGIVGRSILEGWLSSDSGDPHPEGGRAPGDTVTLR